MAGTPTNPIIVRPYPGERPKIAIDYILHLSGSYVQWHEIEFLDAKTDRTVYGGWGWPRSGTLGLEGEYVKLINCVFHDLGSISNFRDALGSEFHGCLLYYFGHVDRSVVPAPPGGPRGTTNYFQNETDVERKLTNNIFFSNHANHIQAYGSDAAKVQSLTMEGNTFFDVGKLFAGDPAGQTAHVWTGDIPARNIKFNDNYLYGSTNDRGHLNFPGGGGVNVNLEMKNNRFVGGSDAVYAGQWEPWVFTGNKIWNRYKAVTTWVNPLPTNPS
ncbi:MAG: hypothetical protein LC775_09995, partial [Acidobacteria bacterium]|nr:hypothetical protein [Acidobacteriota bacterium]